MTNEELMQAIAANRVSARKLDKELCALLTQAAKRAQAAGHVSAPVTALATTPKDN